MNTAAWYGTLGGFAEYCGGYAYAKAAALPVEQVALITAVWGAADIALASFIQSFLDSEDHKQLAKVVVTMFSSPIAFEALRRNGFLGNRMLTVSILVTSLITLDGVSVLLGNQSILKI